jgi:hypothetical protein
VSVALLSLLSLELLSLRHFAQPPVAEEWKRFPDGAVSDKRRDER